MIKRTITETVKEFDNVGNLIKETITKTEEDSNDYSPTMPSISYSNAFPVPDWTWRPELGPTCAATRDAWLKLSQDFLSSLKRQNKGDANDNTSNRSRQC